MAKQKGIIPLKGTIGNITFYKTADGYLAKEKGGVDANRIANDPAFQRTRENGAEFGRAGAGVKLLRTSLRNVLQHSADSKMTARLVREMMKVVKADTTNSRGERNIIDGDLMFLKGFEFNLNGKLGACFYAPFTATVDRVAGELKADVPSFIPLNMVKAPGGTTHYRIVSAGVEIDFVNGVYVADSKTSAILPWDENGSAALLLTNVVTANSTHSLFLALGIEFYQEVNGDMYPLKNGTFNALALVEVSKV